MVDPSQLKEMEAPMIALASSAGGDLRKLMYAFFSFLHRRTDFYLVPSKEDLKEGKCKMGFPEGEAEKLLLAAFRQFPLRRVPNAAPAPENKADSKQDSGRPSTASTRNDCSSKKEGSKVKEAVRYTEEGLQEPVGNGGSTKRYKWTQTLEECTVMLAIPKGMRAKELDVSIKASSIHVKTRTKADGCQEVRTFVEGSLVEKIKPDESTWSLEGGVIILILHKMKKTFWATVIEGDEKIDTNLVDSRRYISDYDEATQGQLRKIIFDQKQAEKGLPASAQIAGTKTMPRMPPGVEYIDKDTFENAEKN